MKPQTPRPPRKKPSSLSILNPQPGRTYFIHVYRRVSSPEQMKNGSPRCQLGRTQAAAALLRAELPDSRFVLIDHYGCLCRRHSNLRAKRTRSRQAVSKLPEHYVIVADGHPEEDGRCDISRITRDPQKLEKLIDAGHKFITAANPHCRRSDLLAEARLTRVEYNRNPRLHHRRITVPEDPTSEVRKKASRRNGMKNRITAKARWKGVVQTVRFIGIFSKSAANLSRRLGG